jgi:hypothetical protein
MKVFDFIRITFLSVALVSFYHFALSQISLYEKDIMASRPLTYIELGKPYSLKYKNGEAIKSGEYNLYLSSPDNRAEITNCYFYVNDGSLIDHEMVVNYSGSNQQFRVLFANGTPIVYKLLVGDTLVDEAYIKENIYFSKKYNRRNGELIKESRIELETKVELYTYERKERNNEEVTMDKKTGITTYTRNGKKYMSVLKKNLPTDAFEVREYYGNLKDRIVKEIFFTDGNAKKIFESGVYEIRNDSEYAIYSKQGKIIQKGLIGVEKQD